MKKFLLSLFFLFSSGLVFANKVTIDHFTITKSELSENKFAIKATDSAGRVLDDVNGQFTFSINGFDENLVFKRGIANDHQQISNSSFIYVKHVSCLQLVNIPFQINSKKVIGLDANV